MEYYTWDNGARPFKVVVEGLSVVVFKDNYEEEVYEVEPLLSFEAAAIFVGEDPEESHRGNSLLCQTAPGKYIYIGERIIEFDSEYEVISYVSPVHGSSDSYAYATDSNGGLIYFKELLYFPEAPQDIDAHTLCYKTSAPRTPIASYQILCDRL